MDGAAAKFVLINQGVPQGTALGPILFFLMLNDLTAINAERNLLIKFADDKNLDVRVGGDQDPSTEEVDNIINWSTKNRMKLNLSKT